MNPIYWPLRAYRMVWFVYRYKLARKAYEFGCEADVLWLRLWSLNTMLAITMHAAARLEKALKDTENERLM